MYIQVEREKMRTEEVASKSMIQRSSFDQMIQKLEEDNVELQRQVQNTQTNLADTEQGHAQR